MNRRAPGLRASLIAFVRRIAAVALAALSACTLMPMAGGDGPPAAAPAYAVGDRWVYDAQDGFFRTVAHWVETHEVVAVSPAGVTVRVTQKGATVDSVRTEQWAAPGVVRVGAVFDNETRRFATALSRYDYPLVPGKSWNQHLEQLDETTGKEGVINRQVRVGGWTTVTTPAGTFDAIQLRIAMWLDDETFWRWPTSCNYLLLYAPAVRAMVREEKEAQYIEKGYTPGILRSQHAVLTLTSFTPGKP